MTGEFSNHSPYQMSALDNTKDYYRNKNTLLHFYFILFYCIASSGLSAHIITQICTCLPFDIMDYLKST